MSDGLGLALATTLPTVFTRAIDGFSPLDIPNLMEWLDANDLSTITESGGDVSQWDNKSESAFGVDVVQASAVLQPGTGTKTQNGKNLIEFDGTEYFRNNNLASGVMDLPGDFTLMMGAQLGPLASQNTWAGFCGKSVLGGGGNRWMFQRESNTANMIVFGSGGSRNFPNTLQANPPFFIFGARRTGTTWDLFGNGSIIQTQTGSVTTAAGTGDFILGAERTNIPALWDLGEKCIFDRALDADEIEDLSDYLMAKWGVS